MSLQSHAYFGGSQDATAMQASVHTPWIASSTTAAGSAEKIRKAQAEAASVAPEDAPSRASVPGPNPSLQETPTPGVLASKALKPTDGIKDIPQGVNGSTSSADTESSMDSAGEYCLGLKQLALQSVLLLVSWGFLALLQPNGRPLLLLVAIALSRLHLGWLLCCVLRMLLPRCSSKEPSECLTEPNQGGFSAFFWRLRRRCWSRLPLRYWHSAFYLFLLLVAFWAASVVWEDSQDGLQTLQSGEGTPLPPSQAWMGGGFPSLLLNSDSPQHVKIAATAVARGREASDRLLWLLHSTAEQQFGRVLLWLRSLTFWLNSVLLQPFVALLRHTGLVASVNGTCSISDAPEAAHDSVGSEEGWFLWVQAAIQSAVRSLPNAAQTFLCGEKASGHLNVEEEAAVWSKRAPEAPHDFEAEGSVVELGPYCLALLLLLAYSLSTALHRVGLAGFAAFRHFLVVWGLDQGGSSKKPWAESLAVASRSALTAFAAAFVLLALVWGAAAVATQAVVLMRSVWRRLFGQEPADPARGPHQKETDDSTSSRSVRSDVGGSRGAVGLEILAACLTCWVLLLSDREFVMFTWATMQPLRLSVLSTVLLLRLPSSQVATLLTWPAPLREPALVLQRSQPLRIIDPVAVGSMLGCVLAAATLSLVLHLAAKLGGLFKRQFASSCATQADADLQLLGASRGQWGVRSSSSPPPSGGDSPAPNTLWQKLQEQNQVIAELQASLKKERCRASLAEELIAKLKEEARAQIVKAPPAGLPGSKQPMLPNKTQVESPRTLAVAEGVGSGQAQQGQHQDQPQHNEQQEQPKQQQNHEQQQQQQQQQQDSGDLAKDSQQQVLGTPQNQTNTYAEELQEAQKQLEELQRQLCGAQGQLSELQQQRDSEASAYERLQQRLEAEAEQWRKKEEEARAECDRLRADLAEVSRSLEGLKRAQGEQQQQAVATQAEDKAHIKHMTQLLQKQAEDLANKTAQINELREKLTQVASTYAREAVRLVDSHSQTPLVEGGPLLEQTGGPPPNEVVEQVLLELSGITHRIKQNVENDTKTVNFHKTHLSSLVSRASPNLSHASGPSSTDPEPQPNHSSRDTALSGEDAPLLEEPNSVDPSPRKGAAAFRRPDRKEALLKEESRKLEQALQTISKCIFPLCAVLERLELPRGTLDDARRLLATTRHYTGDGAWLQQILARPSSCTWMGDVKALAEVLAELGRAWPSEESCTRLLQREGDVHTLSPFLPLASLPHGRQRVAMVHFVLGLNAQWQAACCRLDRLEAALWLLRRSPVLRTLCAICAALYEEMNRAFISEGFGEAADNDAEKKEAISAAAAAAPTRWCARIWETSESRDAALEMFEVWKDNGDFNFACLKNASNIHPPSLKGLSLLHLILSRALAATGEGEGKPPHAGGGEGEGEGAFLQRLKTEVYGSISAPSSSSALSDTKSSAVSPASCPSTAPAPAHKCDCAICLDADLAPHGPPRDWKRQLLTMKEKQIFKIPSRKTFSPSTDSPPSQSPTPAAAAKEQVLVHLTPYGSRLHPASTGPERVVVAAAERKPKAYVYPRASVVSYLYHYRYSVYIKSVLRNRLTRSGVRGAGNLQENRSVSDGLEAAIAIVTLYCDDLTGRQNKLAEMGRHLQQEFSVANRYCSGWQGGGLFGAASVVSQATSRGSSGSPGSVGGGSVSIRKPLAPPAAEAASAPGHVPTETERGLELACQILKNVHAAVPLLTDAWSDLRSIHNKEAITVMTGLLEAWPLTKGATDRTVLSKLPLLLSQADIPPLRAMVAKASSAAVAAEAAVKAQEAARRVIASEIAAQPQRSLGQEEINRLTGLAAAKNLHLEAADGSSRGSDRSIPCPTLLTCQSAPSHTNKSSRSRQLNMTLPVPSKPTRRIAAGSSSSTSDCPVQGRRPLAHMRNFSGGSAVPPPKQLQGRIGRYNTHPAEGPASHLGRSGGKQHAPEPAVAPPLQQLAATQGQQRRASGAGGGLSSTALERPLPQLRLEGADAASTASAVSGGAPSAAQRLPPVEPAVVVSLEAPGEQSDSGNRSSPSPCLLECLENHFEPGGQGEGALSGGPAESQQALQPQRLDSNASAAAAASTTGAQEPGPMQLAEESS
ncbi:hypothetical protein, conserved [Eimeria brunetti]|uniref:Uncharacterized protein n=1 Tax=Eimeria brunetti TaxID=51314 RepID=U6LMA7_9EIME|nr:hypothetical protein, conserved [Eimeria brunetti]